jgi:YesN/AraC family two-component response regulator
MAPHVVSLTFVDRCQQAILHDATAPATLLQRLETLTRHLMVELHSCSAADRSLIRTAAARVLYGVARRQEVVHDHVLASSITCFVIHDSEHNCSQLFYRWAQLLNERAAMLGASQDARVLRALTFIRRGCRSPRLSLGRTAKTVGVSPGYLDKLLQRDTHQAFKRHLRCARVQAAGHLLIKTLLLEKEIAARVGYANAGGLYRDFRKVHGISPKLYRRQNLNASNKN